MKRTSGAGDLTDELCQIFKEEFDISQSFPKIEEEGTLPDSFKKANVNLILRSTDDISPGMS
jgi:hypothetical protein